MRWSVKSLTIGVLAILWITAGNTLQAQEHPEHPKKAEGAEHPEHPEHPKKAEGAEHPEHPKGATAVSMDVLGKAIEAYVAKDAALKGGYFMVYDAHDKTALTLTLDKVHKDKLAKVAKNKYFACADFKTPKGQVYDLDVFMEGPDSNHLETTEVAVHKKDGKPRYTWYEEGGIWKKKKAKN